MKPEFVRQRLTELRMSKDISELQMSRDLGRSDGYIHHITSGKALPSMGEFFSICDYLDITPESFFNERASYPLLIQKINNQLEELGEEDLLLIISLINRIKKE